MPDVEVIPVWRTLEFAGASDDGSAVGDIPRSYVDTLELVERAFAPHRSKFD